jgi:cell division protein FtsA
MRKQGTIAAIDVGTTKICTTVARIDDGGSVRVLGVGVTPSAGLHKGLVVNINEAKESIHESVRKAEQASGCKVESAYVGVTGRHVNSQNNQAVVAISRNDKLVRPDDLKRVLASARGIKIPSDRKLLHVIPRGYAVDGQSGIGNPVGMHGFRLDVEAHIITAAVNSVQNLVKCVRSIGVDIEDLILEPLASGEAVLSEDERQLGVILADIGGGTTDIAIFRGGSIWHTAILPVAGYQITRDIAIGLGLPFDVAEEMKKKYGNVSPAYETKRAGSNDTLTTNGHGVSHRDLCDIIQARIEEILRLIVLEMPNSDYETLVPDGIVLTGGSSNLAGIEALGRNTLQLPVRVGIPRNIYGITDVFQDPAYATSVGLLLWGARYGRMQTWQHRGVGSGLMHLISRIVDLFH